MRIEFQAELEHGRRNRVISVVAYGDVSDKGEARVALLEWVPGIALTEREQEHLRRSAKWRMESRSAA